MGSELSDKGLSNPFSTGAGGATFEQLVGASYLVSLLSRDIPRGLDWGITQEVKFQHRWSGCLLDDVVISTSDGENSRKLALQVKHDLRFTESDTAFSRVLEDCWLTFTNAFGWEFDPIVDRLGIGLGVYQTRVDRHFRPLLEWARTSQGATEFLQKVSLSPFSSDEKRNYLAVIRQILTDVNRGALTDDELWEFLRCFVVIHFDLEHTGSRDSVDCWNRLLSQTTDRDTGQAQALFSVLTTLVAKYARSAGSIDTDTLRSEIPTDIPLKDRPDLASDLNRLRKSSQDTLASIPDTIGLRVRLPRTEILDRIEKEVRENEIVVLSGEPMVGKSVLLRWLANRLQQEGQVIALSVERLSQVATLNSFLHNINIQNDFASILSAIGSAPLRCILIDGLEKAIDDDRRRVLNDLIIVVRQYNKTLLDEGRHEDYCWRIVLTCRAQETRTFLAHLETRRNLAEDTLEIVDVGALSETEIAEVVSQFPKLQPLATQGHLREILSRPLVLDILTLPDIVLSPDLVPSKLSESWLLDWFWREVVRLGEQTRPGRGHPIQRERALVQFAEQLLQSNQVSIHSGELESEALAGLLSDRLLLNSDGQIQFTHDVLADWALTMWIRQNEKDMPELLLETGEPLRLTRAVQLFSAGFLELTRTPDAWVELLDELESQDDLSPRWHQAALTAPLYSPLLDDILSQMKSKCLKDKGILLSKLLWGLRTHVVQPSQLAYSFSSLPPPEFEKYLAYMSIPIWEQWIPLIRFTLANVESLGDQCLLEFSFVVDKWMTNTNGDLLFRKDITMLAMNLLETRFLRRMRFGDERASSLSYDEENQVRKNLAECVLWAADCLPERVDRFVRENALRDREGNNYGFEELIIDEWGWAPLCRHLPDTAVDIIEEILCRKLKPDPFGSYHHAFFDLAIRHINNGNPPTPYRGPFKVFLEVQPDAGLDLIHRIVNHATKAWRLREKYEWNREPIPQTIQLESGDIKVWGDALVYRWFRYPSVSPDTLTSALMALEEWMNKQLENGTDAKELFERVLQCTKSVAVVGVCVSVALANEEACREAIIPILENPAFWVMDIERFTQDLTAAGSAKAFGTYMAFERDKKHYEELIAIANQPHRKLDIRSSILPIFFTGRNEAVIRVQEAIRSFPDNPPFFFEHEKQDKRLIRDRIETCRIWAAYAEKENYDFVETDLEGRTGFAVQFRLPEELEEQQKEKARYLEETNKLYSFQGWMMKLLEEEKLGKEFTLESAMEYAQELASADDPSYQPQHFLEDSESRANIVAMFAAALVVRQWEWIEQNNYTEWCREQLLIAASRSEPPPRFGNDEKSRYDVGYRRSAARALPILLSKHPYDAQVRQAILDLTGHPNNEEVRAFLFNALKACWPVDRDLVWRCIRALENKARIRAIYRKFWYLDKNRRVVMRGKNAWLKRLIARGKRSTQAVFTRFYKKPIRDCTYVEIAPDVFQSSLYALPAGDDVTHWGMKKEHTSFLEDSLSFTVNNYIHYEQKDKAYNEWSHHVWNRLFFPILANAILRLPESMSDTLLDSILGNWEDAPSMMEALLRELRLVGTQPALEARFLEIWLRIGDEVLASDYSKAYNHFHHREMKDILGLLIFTDPSGILKWKIEKWDPLRGLARFIDHWVETVGHFPDCSQSLVLLLRGIGFELTPEHGIGWLYNILRKTEDPDRFFDRSRSASALAELLHDSWLSQEARIKQKPETMKQFGFLVDKVAEQGESIAIRLQSKIQG